MASRPRTTSDPARAATVKTVTTTTVENESATTQTPTSPTPPPAQTTDVFAIGMTITLGAWGTFRTGYQCPVTLVWQVLTWLLTGIGAAAAGFTALTNR
jgi:hypothetical protein